MVQSKWLTYYFWIFLSFWPLFYGNLQIWKRRRRRSWLWFSRTLNKKQDIRTYHNLTAKEQFSSTSSTSQRIEQKSEIFTWKLEVLYSVLVCAWGSGRDFLSFPHFKYYLFPVSRKISVAKNSLNFFASFVPRISWKQLKTKLRCFHVIFSIRQPLLHCSKHAKRLPPQ